MLSCLVSFSLSCFFGLLPWYAQLGIIIGISLILFGIVMNVWNFFSKIGGWPAGAGILTIIAAIVTAILIGGKKTAEKWKEPAKTGESGFQLPNIFGKRDGKKRTYDPDTNTWR